MFLEISKTSNENIYARVSFLIKVAGLKPPTLLKRDSGTDNFLWILQNISERFFYGTPLKDCLNHSEGVHSSAKLRVISESFIKGRSRNLVTCDMKLFAIVHDCMIWVCMLDVIGHVNQRLFSLIDYLFIAGCNSSRPNHFVRTLITRLLLDEIYHFWELAFDWLFIEYYLNVNYISR